MKLWISILGVLVVGVALAHADDAPVRVAPWAASKVSIVPTESGYGLVWWDFRDAGSSDRPEGGPRFMPLDVTGQPVGPDVPIEIDDMYGLAKYYEDFLQERLEAIRDGYVLFAQVDGLEIDTLPLDGTGYPRGDTYPLASGDELYPLSVAQGPAALVMTYPEWSGAFENWSQVVDDEGHADGDRLSLALARRGLDELYDRDSTVARDGPGFFAVWNQYPIGIRLRELSPQGAPVGQATVVHRENCTRNVAAAATAATEAIVYSEGCDQKDVFLLLRDRQGGLTGPITLSAEPYDEGYDRGYDDLHPLQLVSTGSRFAVLYEAAPVDPYHYPRWFLVEFDEAGNPIGAKRDLVQEFGIQPGFDGVAFTFDARRGRYVIAWGGDGPQGSGLYLLALSPSR